MATIKEDWRSNLIAMADELMSLTGKSATKISKEFAGNIHFYSNLQSGTSDIMTDRNLLIHTRIEEALKKARRKK